MFGFVMPIFTKIKLDSYPNSEITNSVNKFNNCGFIDINIDKFIYVLRGTI